MNKLVIFFISLFFQMLIGLNASDNAIDANWTKYLNDKIILGINRINVR